MKKVVKPLKTVYEQNDRVKVTVTNKPVYVDEALLGYDPKITIEVTADYKAGAPFEFKDDDEIIKFVEAIDLEDPQAELPLGQ